MALSMPSGSVRTVFADASCSVGWAATPGDPFLKRKRSAKASHEGISWKELWVLARAFEARQDVVKES